MQVASHTNLGAPYARFLRVWELIFLLYEMPAGVASLALEARMGPRGIESLGHPRRAGTGWVIADSVDSQRAMELFPLALEGANAAPRFCKVIPLSLASQG